MIVSIGESLIDFVPERNAGVATDRDLPSYRPVAGGSPYNCAIAAARLSGCAGYIGSVSDDFFGDFIVDHLIANGVDTAMVSRVAEPTTLAFVNTTPDGSARYAFYTQGSADRALRIDNLPTALPDGALLQIGSISLIADPAAGSILHLVEREAARRIVVLDPNVRPSVIDDERGYRARVERAIALVSVVKISDEDLAWLYPDVGGDRAIARLRRMGPRLVVVTRGGAGTVALHAAGRVEIPARQVAVVDTIGAGDAFMAALLVWLDEAGMRRPEDVERLTVDALSAALRFATRVAAITCTRVGADPPRRSELPR